jgi:hypothetical protein
LLGGGVLVYLFALSWFMLAMLTKGFNDLTLSYWINHGASTTAGDDDATSFRNYKYFERCAIIYGMSGVAFLALQVCSAMYILAEHLLGLVVNCHFCDLPSSCGLILLCTYLVTDRYFVATFGAV